jgi:hypothetical protein
MSDGHAPDVDAVAETDEVLAPDMIVERLLDGVDEGSLPASFRVLLPFVAAARRPATVGELAREPEMVEMFRGVRPAVRHAQTSARRRSLGVRMVVVAGLVSASTATAAAAAGRLPEPVQESAAAVLAEVGFSVPAADVPSEEPAIRPADAVVPAVPTTDAAGDDPTTTTTGASAAENDEAAGTSDQPNPIPPPTPAREPATVSPDEAAATDDGQDQSHGAGSYSANPDAPGQSGAPGHAGRDKDKDSSKSGNGHGQPKKKT